MPPEGPTDAEWASLKDWATSVSEIKARLDRMENVVRELASSHLPSLSALLGPFSLRDCVWKLMESKTCKVTAGTMQILGAEKAFFNHLKTGAPSPKHGHIFMHPWISRSPRWVEERSLEPLLLRQVSPHDAMHTVERSGAKKRLMLLQHVSK